MARNDFIMVGAVAVAAVLGYSALKNKYGNASKDAANAADSYNRLRESLEILRTDPDGIGKAVSSNLFGAGVSALDWYSKYQQGFVSGMIGVGEDVAKRIEESLETRNTESQNAVASYFDALLSKLDKTPATPATPAPPSAVTDKTTMQDIRDMLDMKPAQPTTAPVSTVGVGYTADGIRYNTAVKEVIESVTAKKTSSSSSSSKKTGSGDSKIARFKSKYS